ncbi:unnamed protein product [Adineta ricciae]|uniref:RING-type domain-containing protein n=1 Tax=Adineta ricciae TaxID=249248 RepID=A0A813YYL2_ADIRI|nr:unnamed protein product [Adineta ricciae]CAF0891049.1 unnamed protein product [Adineta ricciae]
MASNPEFRRVVNYTDLEALLECPLCLDRFDQPRLIPCGHTYCTKCLNELCARNDTVICPQCRKEHDVPPGGITVFPRNLSYQQLLDIRTEQLVSTRQCQVCDKKRAFSDCLHCHKAVCLDCKQMHRRELTTTTDSLLLNLTQSTDLCKDALNTETVAFLTHCDAVKRHISVYAKETIDLIKQQEKQLKNDLEQMIAQQLESSKKILVNFEKNKEEISKFVRSSKQKIERNESLLDEQYIEIQNNITKYMKTIQNVVTTLKNKRKDIVFTPNPRRPDCLGELNLIPQVSPTEHSTSVSMSADDKNNQQQQLAPISGIRQVGQWGNGPMEFWCPCGLAITRNNEHLIVVDSWNHRLQMLTIDGQFIRATSGTKGRGLDELNNPRDVCVNTSNEWIIVSDSGNHRLVVYDLKHFQVQRVIGGKESQLKLHLPYGICCDDNDSLYVCDRGNHRIVVIRFDDGVFLRQWGKKGVQHGEFDTPDFICCRQNVIAVSDFNNHRVQVFGLDGQFLFTFGKIGSGDTGEFRYPRGIAIDDEGFFIVADWVNNRLQLFTPNGELSAIVSDKNSDTSNDELMPLKVAFDRPIGLTVSSQGVVFVTEWGRSHRIIIY